MAMQSLGDPWTILSTIIITITITTIIITTFVTNYRTLFWLSFCSLTLFLIFFSCGPWGRSVRRKCISMRQLGDLHGSLTGQRATGDEGGRMRLATWCRSRQNGLMKAATVSSRLIAVVDMFAWNRAHCSCSQWKMRLGCDKQYATPAHEHKQSIVMSSSLYYTVGWIQGTKCKCKQFSQLPKSRSFGDLLFQLPEAWNVLDDI